MNRLRNFYEGTHRGHQRRKRFEADNAEYDAIVQVATELGRVHRVSPLTTIEIPAGEGFALEGERHFGFWAVLGYGEASGTFCRNIREVVGALNRDRRTALFDNINDTGTQAIIHGISD